MRFYRKTAVSRQAPALSIFSSGTSTDNGRQAPANVPAPAASREEVARRLAALEVAGLQLLGPGYRQHGGSGPIRLAGTKEGLAAATSER